MDHWVEELEDQVVTNHQGNHPTDRSLVALLAVHLEAMVVMETETVHMMEINHHTEVSCQLKNNEMPFHMLIWALED